MKRLLIVIGILVLVYSMGYKNGQLGALDSVYRILQEYAGPGPKV